MGQGKGKPMVNAQSLGELKRANASLNEQYNRVNEILDYRKQEVQGLMQQLYTQVEDFRLNQHTELRREIEVAYDLAVRYCELEWKMQPWWKRFLGSLGISHLAVSNRANFFLRAISDRTNVAHKEAEAEMEHRLAEDNARKAQMEAAEKARVAERKPVPLTELKKAADEKMAELNKETDAQIRDIQQATREQQFAIDREGDQTPVEKANEVLEEAGAKIQMTDDYGRPMKEPLVPEEMEHAGNRSVEQMKEG